MYTCLIKKKIFESGRALTREGREREISFFFRRKRKSDMIKVYYTKVSYREVKSSKFFTLDHFSISAFAIHSSLSSLSFVFPERLRFP